MFERIKNTTSFIRSRLGISGPEGEPQVGIILGSGLGELGDKIEAGEGTGGSLPYAEIPDFPQSTVPGHTGRFVYGTLGGKRVIAMQGRVHFYEGYPMAEVVLPVRAMCALGIRTLVVSNAAGGVNPLFEVGDLMVIDDHINLIPNPLIGRNEDELGPRFPDMSAAYDRQLMLLAHIGAKELGISLRQGCYLGSTGPTFETPAEYRYFRTIGADACGMSTTPEVIVARHQGVRVLGFSLITNIGLAGQAGSHAEVMEAGIEKGGELCRLVERVIEKL